MAFTVASRARRLRPAAVLAAWGALATPVAAATLHSAPLLSIPGTGDHLRCSVANTTEKPIASMGIQIRSTNFGTTLAEQSCAPLPPGADCTLHYPVSGVPLIAYFACRVDTSAAKAAVRGVFYNDPLPGGGTARSVELH